MSPAAGSGASASNPGGSGGGSALFVGFRALGLCSNHLAHVLRYHRRHREFYLVTAVGRSFHTYNVSLSGRCGLSHSGHAEAILELALPPSS